MICNLRSCSSTSQSISTQATALHWDIYSLDWNYFFTKDEGVPADAFHMHRLGHLLMPLPTYPEALLVRLHGKQAHLPLWYTLHATSCGWWIKLLLSCSLTIHFIHKPKILLKQAIGWERATQKDGVLSVANERPVVCSLPLSLACLLSCSIFNPLSFLFSLSLSLSLTLPQSPPECITAVKTTAWLTRAQCRSKCYSLRNGDSWTRLSTYTFRVDCTCSESLLKSLRDFLSGDLVLSKLSHLCILTKALRPPTVRHRWQGKAL